jgi:hypothetical protein
MFKPDGDVLLPPPVFRKSIRPTRSRLCLFVRAL